MASLVQRFAPGTIVGGRYRVEALLGQGGSGAVLRATQLNLDRPVALKALLPEALGDDGLARFQREAAIVQQLSHPNVVRLLDFGVGAGAEPYLVFELLEGQTLEEALRAGGAMPPARVARVAAQVLKALMEAHRRGIVHRDVKPANVFLCNFEGERDFVKLLDFGIASGGGGDGVTDKGGMIGTPAYMAPEQVTGGEATFATDLYALGLTMAEALTGQAVFREVSLIDIVREHVSPGPVPLGPAALEPPLGPIVHRATQKEAARRYPSAAEMLAHLDAAMRFAAPRAAPAPAPGLAYAPTAQPVVLEGYPVVPAAPVAAARAPGKKRGAPWAVLAVVGGGVVVLAGVLAAVVSLTGGRGDRGAAPRAAGSAGPAGLVFDGFRREVANALVEAQVNGDGVVDFVGSCGTETASGPPDVCAVDGATFQLLWRRPAGFAEPLFAAAGRSVVLIDPGGVAHVLDAATGAEQGAVRLGARADWVCSPAQLPGKLWIRTTQPRGLLLDTAARTVVDAARPSVCVRGLGEHDCWGSAKPFLCPLQFAPVSGEGSGGYPLLEGGRGVALTHRKGDAAVPMLVGFEPFFGSLGETALHASKVLWLRTLAPGDGLGASASSNSGDFGLSAGRAVASYDEASGKTRLVAADAATGRTLWEVGTPGLHHFAVSPTRVYVGRWNRLDVRDAATGRLLGGVGQEE